VPLLGSQLILASPDPGVVCPIFGLLILLIWAIGNLIEKLFRKMIQRRTQNKIEPRGFEVKLTGDKSVEQRKDNDHG
jgi:UPF0716 family protein affecting phage T7 exclusion